MRDMPRIAFLVVVNVLMLVLLAALLDGCVAAPTRLRYEHGDFVGNIAAQTGAAATATL